MNLLIVGCSRRKRATTVPVSALELYEGGCIPPLRRRAGHRPELRAQILILSAEHGLLSADQPLLPYERRLTPARALELRPGAAATLSAHFSQHGTPEEALVVAEPLYQSVLEAALFGIRLNRIDDPRGWDAAATVLDSWGWP